MCAAIALGRHAEHVLICEKTDRLGKKILASGNGRCNLLNDDLSDRHYNVGARKLVKSVFGKFGKAEILEFFRSLGLEVYYQNGRVFPVTNQASSVLKVLEIELCRLSVPVEYGFNCIAIMACGNKLVVISSQGKKIECEKVILTGGGKSYPAFGSDGSAYAVAAQLGHTIIEPVPCAVPLVVRDNLCHILQGQRILAAARSVIDGQEGEVVNGELLFTKYGLSGTCIIDVSEPISIALNRHRKSGVALAVDLVPLMDEDHLKDELKRRLNNQWLRDEMLCGILPNKMASAFKYLFETDRLDNTVKLLKNWRFNITSTRGWNEAEFTAGGINTSEIKVGTLESMMVPRVYFAGEVMDVNGPRGGYNLGWAWASGHVAATSIITSL